MTIAHVVSTSATFGASSGGTSAIDTTGANLLVVVVSSYYGAAAPTLTDSNGNTWTSVDHFVGSGAATNRLQMYYCIGGTVGAGHTVTCTISGAYGSVAFAGYSGVASTTPLDQHTINGVGGATSVQAGSVTPSEANEVVIVGLGYQTAAATASIDGGFTKRVNDNPQSGVSFGVALGDLIQTTATAANPTWSWTGAGDAAAVIATFKQAGGGDTTPPVLTTPTGSATGPTTATVGATTDEGNGTLYAVVTTSATQPSVAQIKAGQTHTGSAAPWGGSVAVSSTGAKTLSSTGLTASTAYYGHLVHSDAAGNDSNRVSSATFSTPAVPGLTSNPLKNNTGTLLTNQPFEAYVSNPSTGALVLKKTGLTSHATTAVVTFTDASLTAATAYRVVWRQTSTGAEGLETLTAT